MGVGSCHGARITAVAPSRFRAGTTTSEQHSRALARPSHHQVVTTTKTNTPTTSSTDRRLTRRNCARPCYRTRHWCAPSETTAFPSGTMVVRRHHQTRTSNRCNRRRPGNRLAAVAARLSNKKIAACLPPTRRLTHTHQDANSSSKSIKGPAHGNNPHAMPTKPGLQSRNDGDTPSPIPIYTQGAETPYDWSQRLQDANVHPKCAADQPAQQASRTGAPAKRRRSPQRVQTISQNLPTETHRRIVKVASRRRCSAELFNTDGFR
jgi:hypothetical protein